MANSHPYISGHGNITKIIEHLRNSFPQTIDSAMVKKLGLASKNESSLINILQFIGIIDEGGKKTPEASFFSTHNNEDFSKQFSNLIKKAYVKLFNLYSEKAWTLNDDKLITFFRNEDETSSAIGKRQASTFKTLAAISGHGEILATRANKSNPKSSKNQNRVRKNLENDPKNITKNIGLTVRIEINLPSGETKETYDAIFKSIKENLINDQNL